MVQSPSSSAASSASSINRQNLDPVTRTALRYTISAKEYEVLHQYLASRAPSVQKRALPPRRFEAIVETKHDDSVSTVRASLRVFITAYLGLKGWDVISRRLRPANTSAGNANPKASRLRMSASLSLILLFHRLLHRFFLRLRAALLEPSARPFRRRNPRISLGLTSKYTPAVGAALSGLFLGVCPASQLRISVAIYVFSRSIEFAYNAAEDQGIWGKKGKPDWVGSWMLMPFACGQLLHAFIFDRECFPTNYGSFILKRSPEYIQQRPSTYPSDKTWPATFDIVDGLAEISRLRWPSFVSPILFPAAKQHLPASISHLSPITAPSHPAITNTSCALLHPHDPSCMRTYVKYFIAAFPSTARFFTVIYAVFALLSYKSFIQNPMQQLNRLAAKILRMSLFITGSIGTAWGTICLFATYLPRTTLATQRWFLSGFIGGLWAFVARRGQRSSFIYSARMSLDSFWKVGVKRGWWKGVKGGDVMLFAASLALIDALYETKPNAVRGAMIRKGMGVLRGEGWVDRTTTQEEQRDPAAEPVDKKEE
ncbi:hypothetical protein E4T43_02857 [Aureobasidium subglaciale]|nr:hypothetical protein E4T43_02857 [Aureobasidium subglaciale]